MSLKNSKALNEFRRRNDELRILEEIVSDITKAKAPKLKNKKNTQRNIQLVFLITIWETFVEELLMEAVEHICSECKDPLKIPGPVTDKICSQLAECKDKRKIWNLTGDNWKKEYLRFCEEKIAAFNTPRPANIDKLVQDCIGLKNVSGDWSWKGMSNTSAKRKINDKITVRGDIIHQLNRQTTLSFDSLLKLHSHLVSCCLILSDQLRDHVKSITGKYPWHRLVRVK